MITLKMAGCALLIVLMVGFVTPHLSVAAPIAQQGNKSENVRVIQYLLRAHGAKVQVDGNFGSDTHTQVLNFQRARKLDTSGIVDTTTWQALIITVRLGSNGDAVRAVQSKLRTLGYRVTVDGVFGAQTKEIVVRFQGNHGVTKDGVVGPETWSELLLAAGDEVTTEGAGGTLRPASGKRSAVRLLSEDIRFDIYDGDYTASATFALQNPGPATTLILTFPELITDPDPAFGTPGEPAFKQFTVYLNGRAVAAQRLPIAQKKKFQQRRANWQRRVSLRRGQRLNVCVNWKAKHVFSYVGVWVAYDFAGGQWADEAAERSMTATFHRPGTAYPLSAYVQTLGKQETDDLDLQVREKRCFYRWRDKAPNGLFTLNFEPTVPGWLSDSISEPAVTVPGKVDWTSGSENSGFIWLPDAVLRDGRAFVALDDMEQRIIRLKSRSGVKGGGNNKRGTITWAADEKSATVFAGQRNLHFQLGQPKMKVDGERWVTLPAAPFRLGCSHPHDGPYTRLYVPLAPILKEWGGTVQINAANHHLLYEGPAFRSITAEDTDD